MPTSSINSITHPHPQNFIRDRLPQVQQFLFSALRACPCNRRICILSLLTSSLSENHLFMQAARLICRLDARLSSPQRNRGMPSAQRDDVLVFHALRSSYDRTGQHCRLRYANYPVDRFCTKFDGVIELVPATELASSSGKLKLVFVSAILLSSISISAVNT